MPKILITKKLLLTISAITIIFIIGFFVGFRNGLGKKFPYGILKHNTKYYSYLPKIIRNKNIVKDFFGLSDSFVSCSDDDCILNTAFSDELKVKYLVYPPINSPNQIKELLQNFEISKKDFDSIRHCIITNDISYYPIFKNISISRTSFNFNRDAKIIDSYAYYVNTNPQNNKKVAFLVIPGSGNNQSTDILLDNPQNYHHGIRKVLEKYGDIYIYIKPNEDILAFSSKNRKRLNYGHITNYLLNRGHSYSYYYLTQIIAWIQTLKKQYQFVGIFGLSQGGLASLICGLNADADLIFCGSGYTVLFRDIEYSNHRQIILNNAYFNKLDSDEYLIPKIKYSNKLFCFSYGKFDEHLYAYEFKHKPTEIYFAKNNTYPIFIYHNDGHVFPISQIDSILFRICNIF